MRYGKRHVIRESAWERRGQGSLIRKIVSLLNGSKAEKEPAFTYESWSPLKQWRFLRAPDDVQICFSTRGGGASKPPYNSLNLGFHVGDNPANVKSNRSILSSMLGLDANRITSPAQRHTAIVRELKDESMIGAGSQSEESDFDPCDGLLTSLEQTPLLLQYADCVPVVLTGVAENPSFRQSESGRPWVAVLHAGRQGLVEGVIENGIRLARETCGTEPVDVTAAIGPAIGSCCYEVDEKIASDFEARFGSEVIIRDSDGGLRLDLQASAESALVLAGVGQENIHILEICTSCDKDFYSYRRDGVTGRHGAIAWIG